MTSPIMLLHSGLGLASQEVDVLANSTNENLWNLYGYDEMTQPQLSIQTQAYNRQDVISIRVSKSTRVRR